MPKRKVQTINSDTVEQDPPIDPTGEVFEKLVGLIPKHKRKKKNPPPKGVKPPQLIPHMFGPGFHPNRNTKGRPNTHDDLKKLIQQIAQTPAGIKVQVDDQVVELTRLEVLILGMFASSDPRDKIALMEHGFGKVPDKMDLNVARIINVTVKRPDDDGDSVDGDVTDMDLADRLQGG